MEVACLLTVMKYYGGQQDARTLAEWCKVDGKYTLMGMKQAAIRAGMEAEICLQNMEQLSTRNFLPYFCHQWFRSTGICGLLWHSWRPLHYLGAGIRPYAILGKPNENIMDKRNNSYSVSHPRIYAENGFQLNGGSCIRGVGNGKEDWTAGMNISG